MYIGQLKLYLKEMGNSNFQIIPEYQSSIYSFIFSGVCL